MIARKLCSRRAVIWWSDKRNHLFNCTLLQNSLYSLLSLHVCVHVSLPSSFFCLSHSLSFCVWVSFTHTEVSSVSSWIFLSQVLCTELATTCCPFNCRTRGAERRVQCARKACKQEELVVKGKNEEAQRWRQAAAAAETKQPSVLHTVYVCVNASVLVSLPLLSALDETKKITVTKERSHGWMKTLLWQSPAVSWKPYADKSPEVPWKDEKFTLTKSSILMDRWKLYSDKKSSRPMDGWKYNSDKWVVSKPDEVFIMIRGWMDRWMCVVATVS